MTPALVAQQLRKARAAHAEDPTAFARLIGIRVEHVHAIEDGRFSDLPSGIYGRSAVKAYASACDLDPVAILADVDRWLVSMDDPIVGLARLKGLRRAPVPPAEASARSADVDQPDMDGIAAAARPLAAALIDALMITALLLLVVLASVTLLLVPVSALERSSPAFGLMGVLIAIGYFLCFGGIRGATVGERMVRVSGRRHEDGALTLRAVAERALQSASEDVRCVCSLGARLGRWLALPPAAAYGNDASVSGR